LRNINLMQTLSAPFLLAAYLTVPPGPYWTPDTRTIGKMEAQMKMPPLREQHKITEYERHYRAVVSDGRHMIYGELDYPAASGMSAGIHIETGRFPTVTGDGGCIIVYSVYDADANKLRSLFCLGQP
jgi:hypothetical protein